MAEILYAEECYEIVGACFEVYNRMGAGFLEAVYQKCLEIELKHRRIPHIPQPKIQLTYRGQTIEAEYQPDFVCYSKILVEIKAITELADPHRAQVLNYLNATGFRLGLLVNFGHFPQLEYERLLLHDSKRTPASSNT